MKKLFPILCFLLPLGLFGQDIRPNHQLLWKISGNGIKTPSWLYGTVHSRDSRVHWLSDSALHAFRESEVFALELHMDSAVTAMTRNPQGDQRPTVSPQSTQYKTFAEFLRPGEIKILEKKLLLATGMSLDQLDPNQPGIFQQLVGTTSSAEPEGGESTFLDAKLFYYAKLLGKDIQGLEQLEEQTALFAELSIPDSWKYLATEPTPAERKENLAQLMDLYQKGDLEGLWAWTQAQWTPRDRKIMAERNQRIARRAQETLRSGKSMFIAVGVSHLPGKIGLVEKFRAAGYQVEPVSGVFSRKNQNWAPPEREIPWMTQHKKAQGYTLDWPLEPALFVQEPIVEIFFLPYVPTGDNFYAGWIRLPVIPNPEQEDEFLSTMTRFLAREGAETQVLERKTFIQNGYPVQELAFNSTTTQGDEQYFRGRFCLRDNYIYLVLAGPGEKRAQGKNANRFFDSFRFLPLNDQPWEAIESAKGGFKVMMPAGTQKLTQEVFSPEEGWSLKSYIWSGGDPKTGANYTLRYNTLPPDRRSGDDEVFLDSNLESMAERMEGEFEWVEKALQAPFPSATFQLRVLETGQILMGKITLRGARSYLALVTANSDSLQKDDAKAFLDSFQFIEGAQMEGKVFELTDFGVSLWFPDLPRVNTDEFEYSDLEEKWAKKGTFYAQDTLTGVTWYYNRESYSPYAFVEDTADFVRQWTDALLEEEDVLKTQRVGVENGLLTLDIKVQNSRSHLVFHRKIWLRGHEVHSLSAWFPSGMEEGEQSQKFFSSLKFISPAAQWTLFEDKRPGLLDRLNSGNPQQVREAGEVLSSISFDPKALPQLHQALQRDLPDDEEEWGIREKIYGVLAEINDPSSARILRQEYARREEIKVAPEVLLVTLAKMKNQEAARVLGTLLHPTPPDLDFDADGYAMMLMLSDSIQLYQDWVSWLPGLVEYPDYELGTYVLLNYGLGVKAFNKKDLNPHLMVLLARGEDLLKMEKAGLEGESVWEASEFLSQLLKVLRFSGYLPEIGGFLREMQEAQDPLLRLQAFSILTEYGYAPDPAYLNDLASHPRTRVALWRQLQDFHKEELFPDKYKKQALIAESLMLEDLELHFEQKVAQIKLMKGRELELRSEEGWGYLFKYQLEDDPDWSYAFCGLQPQQKKEFITTTRFNIPELRIPEGDNVNALFEAVRQQFRE